jgi:hypothetical protein
MERMTLEQIKEIVRVILEQNDGCSLDNKEERNKVINALALGLSGDIEFWANFDKVKG